MGNEVKQRINNILVKINKDFDSVSTRTQNELLKIDETIQKMSKIYIDHKKGLKDSAITISNVSKKSHIARRTFYNNDILKFYVEESAKMLSDNSKSTDAIIAKYKEQISILNKQLKDIITNNVIDTENIKCENDRLTEKLINTQKQYNHLRAEYNNLSSKYDKIVSQLREEKTKKMN